MLGFNPVNSVSPVQETRAFISRPNFNPMNIVNPVQETQVFISRPNYNPVNFVNPVRESPAYATSAHRISILGILLILSRHPGLPSASRITIL